ncbi:MAG: TonB-dependent receptor [Steroidobacteraceae bacterium]
MKDKRAWAALGGLLSVASATQIGAVEKADEEVLVLGTQLEETLPQELARYGNQLEVISAEQIQNGGYNDVTQALQMLVPGLYAVPKNGPFDYVDASLLGSRPGDILFLIDGIRINNRLYNGTSPLDTIPAHMIERIEVLKGGQGIFYGTQSVAGVVNVVTKPFSDSTQYGVELGADSNDGKHANGYVNGQLAGWHAQLYASLDKADGFQPFRDQDYQPSTTDRDRSYDVRSAGLKLGGELAYGLALTGFYQHTEATLDYAYPQGIAKDINDRIEDLISAKLDWEINELFGVYAKGYYHDWSTHYTIIDNDLDDDGNLTGTTSYEYDRAFWGYKDRGLNLMGRLKGAAGFEYLAGVDLQRYSGRDEVYTIAPSSEQVSALFVQLRNDGALLPGTQLALGVRYNHTSGDQSATVWNLSGRHDFSPSLYLRGTTGTSFRLPDAYQLFGAFIDQDDTRGNPNLKPERSFNVDVGLGGVQSLSAGKLSWEVTGYRRRVTDLIEDVEDGFTDVDGDGVDDYYSAYVNSTDRVDMSGAELQLGWQLQDWSANLDQTWSRARSPGSDLQLARIPRTQGKLLLAWAPQAARYSANVSLNYVGSIYQGNADGDWTNYGRYAVVDAGGTLRFGAGARQHVTLSISNLLDKAYASRLGTGYRDSDGESYTVWNLGVPRTWQLRYGYELK